MVPYKRISQLVETNQAENGNLFRESTQISAKVEVQNQSGIC